MSTIGDHLPSGSDAGSPNTTRSTKMSGTSSRRKVGTDRSQEELFSTSSPSSQNPKHSQDNTVQEKEVLSKLPPMERTPSTQYRWNTNEEIASWLYSAQEHSEWCTSDVRIRPPNGSMLLYHKKGSNYKHDGYAWKKRKDGKLPREDHMRLKVKGVEVIYANYVHSSLVPTFHRRSYWLLSHPDIVLVHYLNTPGEGELIDRIMLSLRVAVTQYTKAELLEQLQPMLCHGPLTIDDPSQSFAASIDTESTYEERSKWVTALIDQARHSRSAAVTSTPPPSNQLDLRMMVSGSPAAVQTTTTSSGGTPQTLLVTSLGQFLLAIDPESPEGTALLTAQQQQKQSQTGERSEITQESSPSASSESPPGPCQPPAPFIAPADISEQQQQIARAFNGIRSNSCSSASRRVMCSTIMRRQPSAFSDGADDVFRPLTALTAASSAEIDPLPAVPFSDSAYCSFADARDEEGMEQARPIGREEEMKFRHPNALDQARGMRRVGGDAGRPFGAGGNAERPSGTGGDAERPPGIGGNAERPSGLVGTAERSSGTGDSRQRSSRIDGNLERSSGIGVRAEDPSIHSNMSRTPNATSKSKSGCGDPILCAVGEMFDDSANLGLSQEDIATTLRANLAAMIDKPTTELFGAVGTTTSGQDTLPLFTSRNGFFSSANMENEENNNVEGDVDPTSSPMEEGCSTNFIPSNHLISSPDSFRLLNQIFNGEDYGDEEGDPHSMRFNGGDGRLDKNVKERSSPSSYFQVTGPAGTSGWIGTPGSMATSSHQECGTISTFAHTASPDAGTSPAASCGSSHGSGTAVGVSETRFRRTGIGATSNVDMEDITEKTGQLATARTSYEEQLLRRNDLNGQRAVATITDFSPEWSFPQGGVKILISGPWYSSSHRYHCLFGNISVPACLIQTGVLRCYCPPHEPGTVSLMVCCDDHVISNVVMFEYRPAEQRDGTGVVGSEGRRYIEVTPSFWIGANDNHLCMGLLERLQALERHLGPPSSSFGASSGKEGGTVTHKKQEVSSMKTIEMSVIEGRLVRVCRSLASREWLRTMNGPVELDQMELSHHCGMTVMHFAAALGFIELIIALFDWSSEKKCPLLESELQFTKQDGNGRTALMWACVKGKTEVATVLATGCRDSLFIPDFIRAGQLPLAAAFRDGHVGLVRKVAHQFVAENGGDPNARDLDTALWVLTSGLVERSQLHYHRRPYIHARRHHQPQRGAVADGENANRRLHNPNNSQLRKQLSLDSQMIKISPSGSRNVFSTSTGEGPSEQWRKQRDGNNCGRERAKRASVEGLEELMRHTVDELDIYNYSDNAAGINSRVTAGMDVGLNLSAKITRQDSENSNGSAASYMSVNEWLSMELPMDMTVTDDRETSEMWTPFSAAGSENADGYETQEQIASLAQRIIDALPDRIKHETFEEEDVEEMEQEQQQRCQQQQRHQQPAYCNDDVGCNEIRWEQCTKPAPALPATTPTNFSVSPAADTFVNTADFVSYRHRDVATPCSSCLSTGSVRSPSASLVTAESLYQHTMNDPNYGQRQSNTQQHYQHSMPISPSTYATASSSSSLSNVPQGTFLSAAPNSPGVDGVYTQLGCSNDQQCQPQPLLAEARNLGEFFNATRSRSPLECHFQELTLTDREQRQLYEAAKVIQGAYRQYKQRIMMQTYSEMERQAAVVIQTCYRRYKQYCYFKKLHQAAVLIQKHFRLYKAAKRSKISPDDSMESTSSGYSAQRRSSNTGGPHCGGDDMHLTGFTQFLEDSMQRAIGNTDSDVTMAGQNIGTSHQRVSSSGRCIRIHVTPEELSRWRQHLAAARIQHAFRGHRKRQDAAARKIQKFMREARQKLLKTRTVACAQGTITATDTISAQPQQDAQQMQQPTDLANESDWRQGQPTTVDKNGISHSGCQFMQMNSTKS